jgi:hypothetical protein
MEDMEKRVRRLERMVMPLLVLLAMPVALGALLFDAVPRPALAQRAGSERVVRATRFEVVDEKGRVVGTFGAGADGVVLGIMDRTSRQGAMLGTRADGTAFVAVGDAAGHPNAGLVGAAGAGPTLVVTGKDGKPVWSAP